MFIIVLNFFDMNVIFELLKYVLPGLIVFFTAYFIIKSFLDQENTRKMAEIKHQNQKMITPIRLQAYERIILFLERINPESLTLRLQAQGQKNSQLHMDILSLIRAEYEHNLSQQIYLSQHAWAFTRNAKENIVKLVNSSAERVNPENPSIELARVLIEVHASLETSPLQLAINFLKDEIAKEF